MNRNVYVRGTPLKQILFDGWSRGFDPEQTLKEASAAGYSMCVVKPLIVPTWARFDAEMWAYLATPND